MSAPGGKYYSRWVETFFNYPAVLRKGLQHTSAFILDISGRQSEVQGLYKVRLVHGRGVKIVYGCLGIGVLSFWIAFILANETTLKTKIIFILSGVVAIFFINVARLVLLVIVANKNLQNQFIKNHHDFFNVSAYLFIIGMMFVFDRSEKKRLLKYKSA